MFHDVSLCSSDAPLPAELFPENAAPTQISNNSLDDIFGSSPSSGTSPSFPSDGDHIRKEPSDIPRLRSEHNTSGYRDGLTAAKALTIQEGFDEGYSLGASIGLEVGIMLGILEGIYTAVQKLGHEMESEQMRMKSLLSKAREELNTEKVFGREWWAEDGTWKYEITEGHQQRGSDNTFREVVASHPVLKKWKKTLQDEVIRWGIDLEIMDREDAKKSGKNDGDIDW